MTAPPMVDRIRRVLAAGDPVDGLVGLPGRDLTSLLLHVLSERTLALPVAALLAAPGRTGLFAPSYADGRACAAVVGAALDAAMDFAALELSPVCPLGTTRALSGVHQHNVLSATRGAELLADPTTPLALECARRRRHARTRGEPVRLCTSHRLVRMQPTPPGLLPHFRLFAMVTAGRHAPGFAADELRRHLEVYLTTLRRLGALGYKLADVTVEVSDTDAMAERLTAAGLDVAEVRRQVRTHVFADPDQQLAALGLPPMRGSPAEIPELAELGERVVTPLAAQFPEARVRLDLSRLEGLGYYAGPCVRIYARDTSGAMLPLVDGGYTRWTQELLSDRRERFLATGMGVDIIPARFRSPPP